MRVYIAAVENETEFNQTNNPETKTMLGGPRVCLVCISVVRYFRLVSCFYKSRFHTTCMSMKLVNHLKSNTEQIYKDKEKVTQEL